MFCTIAGEADKIWYSTTLNPELIGTTSNYTKNLILGDERGYARKILTFRENLYVFRDYGITRIINYGYSNLDVKQVYLSDSKIFADTVKVCGDVVVFLTRDGLYSFDGVNVKKQILGIEYMIDKDNYYATAEGLQDKYYLAMKLKCDDGKTVLRQLVSAGKQAKAKARAEARGQQTMAEFQELPACEAKDVPF